MTLRASVVIPTRNRARVLEGCLTSLTRQTLPADAFEVLVVDNGSSDNTPDVARRFSGMLQLVYLSVAEPGLHVGRHAGLRHARSSILMYTDDDTVAEAAWVEGVVESFGDAAVELVGGNNLPYFEEEPPTWLLSWWQRPVYKGRALAALSVLDFGEGVFEIDPAYVWGCNFSIRRDVLLQAGGFHPDGVPLDRLRFRGDGETHVADVVRKSGGKTLFNSRASVRHLVSRERMTKAYFQRRAYAQGISDSYRDIRRAGAPTMPLAISVRRRVGRFKAACVRGVRSIVGYRDPALTELSAVQRAAAASYLQGYAFHQCEVRGDPALLAWVLKEDYRQ